MSDVTLREADVYDIPYLQKILHDRFPTWEQIDFHAAHTILAECDGKPFVSCSARLVWQIEPLLVLDESVPYITKLRGLRAAFKAMEQWIADPAQNQTGIFTYVVHMCSEAVLKWARKLRMLTFDQGFFASKTLTPHE